MSTSDDDEHFAKIAIKPLEVPRECLGETIDFLREALAILDVSYTLREVIEEWCDKHDA